uniref:Secreted protein n=1 Tax=Romanomermis culicivorax TaxID=13658 RepID=A0A915JLQ7_ROMCU
MALDICGVCCCMACIWFCCCCCKLCCIIICGGGCCCCCCCKLTPKSVRIFFACGCCDCCCTTSMPPFIEPLTQGKDLISLGVLFRRGVRFVGCCFVIVVGQKLPLRKHYEHKSEKRI